MTIKVFDNIQEMTGCGAEYLTDRCGNVLAEFYNGFLVNKTLVRGNDNENTLDLTGDSGLTYQVNCGKLH